MSFAKGLRHTAALLFALTCIFTQSRDEVIELTYPVSGSIVDTSFVDVEIFAADFFTLGFPGCTDCDGYIQLLMDGTVAGQFTSDSTVTVTGLAEGSHFIEIEALDPSGASFSPIVYDSATFIVDMVSIANLCPPRNFSVTAGAGRNFLFWSEPGSGASGGLGCGDYLIDALPFMDQNTNVGMGDEWDVSFSDGDDVTYTLNLSQETTLNITLCSANTDYDTKLEIFTFDGTDCSTTYTSAISTGNYNDDGTGSCPQSPATYTPSLLENITLAEGQYYIVVDGFGGDTGNYELNVIESTGRTIVHNTQADFDLELSKSLEIDGDVLYSDFIQLEEARNNLREIDILCGTFIQYNIYNISDNTLLGSSDTTRFIHDNLTNGTEYCYYVRAEYTEGESVNSDSACGTPEVFTPQPVTNLYGTGLDEKVSLSWTDPETPQYTFYENFNSGIPSSWTVTDNNGSGIVWEVSEDGPSGYTLDMYDGFFAIITSFSNTFPNSDLISPSIDLSNYTSATLMYSFNYQDYAFNPTDSGQVYISGDGGTTWTLMTSYFDGTPPGGLNDVLINTISLNSIVGSSDVKIKFHYEVESGESWFFSVDDIIVYGTESSGSRDLTGSSVSTTYTYIPGNTQTMNFSLTVQASDFAYCDSFAVTFPQGITILDAGPSELGFGGEPYGPEPFNGINGQSISWGTNANDGAGGIFGVLNFWATLIFDASLSGPFSVAYHFSDDWYNMPADADGVFTINQRYLIDGDFLGYNIYVNESTIPENTYLIEGTRYEVGGLTNGQTYSFEVTANYYPDSESDTVSVSATPTWLFGDISGTVTDPNGIALDSAIIRSGDKVDTTGSDGIFILTNLDPGVNTVSVQRANFENDAAEVTVLAQEAVVVQNFVLTPTLARPGGLNGSAGDHQVELIWKTPGPGTSYDLAYYDDNFEGQLGCGGSCEFGVRFTPLGYPASLTSILISVQGDASVFSGNIFAFIDESGSIGGPGGTPVILASNLNLTSPDGSLTQYEVDVSDANLVLNSGDVYIMIQENNSGFMGIANDIQPQSPEYYNRNWVGLGDGEYMTIFDAVYGDPTLTGDFGLMVSFEGPTVASVTLNNQNEVVERIHTGSYSGKIKSVPNNEFDIESFGYNRTIDPDNVVRLTDIRLPGEYTQSREDSLLGYHVYQILTDGDSLVYTTSGSDDTTATITVPANYIEYCYNVSARWNTDNYGILESKPSGKSCFIPFTLGDVDFNSSIDITDLLTVVDFVLAVSSPTDDQIRGADVNEDQEINITDVVMIIDIIYGTAARTLAANDTEVFADLLQNGNELLINVDYDGYTRGVQFTLRADQTMNIGTPILTVNDEGVMVVFNKSEDGNIFVVVFNSMGGTVDRSNNSLVRLPYTFTGKREDKAVVELTEVKAAGMAGESLPVTIREKRIDISVVPNVFALHQNYPNPFNPVTEIQFDVPEETQITLTVYNIMGQEVTTLTNGKLKAGFHSIRWDGTNGTGELVGTGLYFYRLSSPSFISTKKMILVK